MARLLAKQRCGLRAWGARVVLAMGIMLGGEMSDFSPLRASPLDNRGTLVFSVDQGFPNGAVANGDKVVLSAIADSLAAFRDRYKIMVLLSSLDDRDKLYEALDVFAAHGVPFVLDVVSSDTVGQLRSHVIPSDASHGIELPLDAYRDIRRRYGEAFAGIRIMEPFSMSYTIVESQYYHKSWAERFRKNWPNDLFYQPALIRPYAEFAAENNMLTIVSDWLWSGDEPGLPRELHQKDNEQTLMEWRAALDGSLVVVYANNEPQRKSTFERWEKFISSLRDAGFTRFGLSDQAWYCDDADGDEEKCPVEILISWAREALSTGAGFVQFEPYYYWWRLPRANLRDNYDVFRDTHPDVGAPTDNFRKLAESLGVQLPSAAP